jgi:PAS domain S-box-containing protein
MSKNEPRPEAISSRLEESEQRYHSLFENMMEGYAYCKMLYEGGVPYDFIYIDVNKAFEKLAGLKDVAGKKVSEVIPGLRQTNPELFETYGRVALTAKPEKIETFVEPLGIWFSVAVYSPAKEYFVAVFDNITERKKAAALLAEREQLYGALFNLSPTGIMLANDEGAILEMNEALCANYGYSRTELLGKNVRLLVAEEYRSKIDRNRTEILQGKMLHHEVVNIDKEGALHWMELREASILLPGGRTGILTVSTDVTERKRSEEALRLFRALIDRSNDAIQVIDPETGRFLDVNEKACLDLGYTREELLTLNVTDIDPTVDASTFGKSRKDAGSPESQLWEGIHRRKDGTTFPVEVNVNEVRLDREYMIATVRDVSERKKAEEALRQSEENYRKFFEDDLTGDYNSTPDGKILSCNPAFARMFGFSSVEEVLQQDVNAGSLYATQEERDRFVRLLHEKKKLEYFEMKFVRRDGKPVYCVENAIGVFDDHGTLVQIRGYLFDDSKRKLLEEQLLQSQKLEGLGTLAGGIAHDFNNLLGIIIGHSALLERSTKDPAQSAKSLQAITMAAGRGAGLVRQLLTFARKTESHYEPLEINAIIEEHVRLLQQTFPKTIDISTTLQQGLTPILADHGQVHQVLLNLCVNARDAMPNGGTLSITTETVTGLQVRVRFANAGAQEYIQINVTDTGVGMDEATRKRIFEPFFTTKGPGKGTGLGLAVAFGIVESHRGFIDAQSTPGGGTSFKVYFPVPEQITESTRQTEKGFGEVAGGGETVLLIEDEEALKELVRIVLVSKGYRVLTAEDGMRGVELYGQHRKEIAVVLSDMGLPLLGGEEVCRRIREINPEAKIIIASGFVAPDAREVLLRAGVTRIIQKPYLTENVLQVVREVIDAA